MQQKINYLPFVLSVIVAFIFVRRVRNENLSKYRKESGGIMWTLLFFDFIFWIGFALCGYYFIIIAFEFTPFLKSFDDYKYISAFVFGIISEHALPLLLEALFFVFQKKTNDIKETI